MKDLINRGATRQLPRNHRTSGPSAYIFVDTEARREILGQFHERQTLRFGRALYLRIARPRHPEKREWITFTTAREFWAFVDAKSEPRQRTWIIAHNAGYDAQILDTWREISSLGWKVSRHCFSDPPWFVEFQDTEDKKLGRTLLFNSSTNWCQSPLADMGKALGLEKLEMPTDDAPFAEWERYCTRDVEVLAAWVLGYAKWVKDNDLGEFRTTVASQALAAFRHRFSRSPIELHRHTGALKLERDAYIGGRVECFRLGDLSGERWLRLDVNSLYPSVMKGELYPVKLLGGAKQCSIETLRDLLSRYLVIARVQLDTDTPDYPTKLQGKCIWPVGQFETTLCTPELLTAINAGHIKRVLAHTWYKGQSIFDSYVEWFYDQRKAYKATGQTLNEQLCKLLLNSLYGKFGQLGHHELIMGECDPEELSTEKIVDDRTGRIFYEEHFAGVVVQRWDEGESQYSFPAIAAHVTSYGRTVLHRIIQRYGREHIAYCDTDCVIVNHGSPQLRSDLDNAPKSEVNKWPVVYTDRTLSIINPSKLGALKLEEDSEVLDVWGSKHYKHGAKGKHKGIRRDAVSLGDNKVLQVAWRRTRVYLKEGIHGTVRLDPVVKASIETYSKGSYPPMDNGSPVRVSPLRLELPPL